MFSVMMMMSGGVATFLGCFVGFWLLWAALVTLCCFCSFLQRRLKDRPQRPVEAESVSTTLVPPPAHPLTNDRPPLVQTPDQELWGNPPCYEEAVLMEAPPPGYGEAMGDALKLLLKVPAMAAFQERGCSSHCPPSYQHWDYMSHTPTPPGAWPLQEAASHREPKSLNPGTTQGPGRGLQSVLGHPEGGLNPRGERPTLGRSTAV